MAERNHRFSPFSVILIMIALSVVGIASLPLLNIQHKPSSGTKSISVSFSYPGASAEIVEGAVTCKIEGVLSGIMGNTGISSVSRKGTGTVTVDFGKDTDMAAARFEVASVVRNIYSSLPKGVTYPVISLDASGGTKTAAISYLIKGDLPSQELVKYAQDRIVHPISAIDGVDNVSISGGSPFEWVITFDNEKAEAAGIGASDISSAFRNYFSEDVLGLTQTPEGILAVRLNTNHSDDFGAIPIKKYEGRIICLRDIADWSYRESLPDSYYRVNGLNTVTLAVGVSNQDNLLVTVKNVKKTMESLQSRFPEQITVSIAQDSSEYVTSELNKIYLRTGLCLLILLIFIYLTSRSLRYLFVIFSTLVVNILTALAIYNFAGIQIHIYTLAGITVSLGIIIDTTIVMADHYRAEHNRKAFGAIAAAVGTTIVALLLVLLLPESERANLTDFIFVIIVNLSLSLVISYFFVPSLLEVFPVEIRGISLRRKHFYASLSSVYRRYINWGTAHRWVLVLVFVMAFGIPVFLLPNSKDLKEKKDKTFLENVAEKVVNWSPYGDNRVMIDKILGSSFGRFYSSLSKSNFYREPQKKVLHINAGLLEGCTVHQLNEVVKSMENYLAQFDQIESFTTSITSYRNADISVYFKPEYENTGFPISLKSEVMHIASNFGGANWRVNGIDDSFFNNNIVSFGKSNAITLKGYNFKELCRFAGILIEYLSENRRVDGPELWGAGYGNVPDTEFNLDYDYERLAVLGISPQDYYSALSNRLYSNRLNATAILRSASLNTYDLWNMKNTPIVIDSVGVDLSDVGSIEKKRSGIDIFKENQIFEANVVFDFIGSTELCKKVTEKAVKYMNEEVLPVGFKAEAGGRGWFNQNKEKFAWLILLIVLAIYVMLSIEFNSLRYPFAVIFMIPVSFIGLFLVFGLSYLMFAQGGFAALVMLCGIVVNAGIYLTDTYLQYSNRDASNNCLPKRQIFFYIHSFRAKIVPIGLTIISTLLGLIPFLTDGPTEVFWFDFAIGTISGLAVSVLAILFYLPVFMVRNRPHHPKVEPIKFEY